MTIRGSEFDWSLLNRQGLTKLLWMVREEIIDKPLTSTKIHAILANHIRKHLPVRVVKKTDSKVDFGWIYVGGCYYSDYDEDFKKSIEIVFVYNPFEEKLCLNKSRFQRICRTFSDVVLHELIHMRQYRRREFKILPDYESNAERTEQRQEQSYLGCTDEIDAYSFNIACELIDRFGLDYTAIVNYVGAKHWKGRLKSNSLRMYLKAFDYNHDHRIIKRLKKRVIRYLPNAELGRPYRTSEWINC
jgi:hypothetical protein